jgi:hypothetical protein
MLCFEGGLTRYAMIHWAGRLIKEGSAGKLERGKKSHVQIGSNILICECVFNTRARQQAAVGSAAVPVRGAVHHSKMRALARTLQLVQRATASVLAQQSGQELGQCSQACIGPSSERLAFTRTFLSSLKHQHLHPLPSQPHYAMLMARGMAEKVCHRNAKL